MKTAIVLFDQDLRIDDNPAFFHAAKDCEKILSLFIFDEALKPKLGMASKWFLHFALQSFSKILKEKYSLKLACKKGDSIKILEEIFAQKKISEIYFNKLIEPGKITLHNKIKKLAQQHGIEVHKFQSQTIFDPEKIKNGSKNYYKVFTPFWKNCLDKAKEVEPAHPAPKQVNGGIALGSDDLDLLPSKNWADGFAKNWKFDYEKIHEDFSDFLHKKISYYKEGRDFPALDVTSKISPYLHFGMISPRRVFLTCLALPKNAGTTQFLNEIGWREFCHYLLYHFPQLPQKNFRPEFDKFSWAENNELLKKWQCGQTGYPIVDAGMRELWKTGYMHNRVRMITASFLVKDLLIDWREGEKWFWDCLLDADLANNTASWQWVAGSGADAAPYFRIFNPVTQGEKFDATGEYVRKWIPEIAALPNNLIHQPWRAKEEKLKDFGIELGKTYPLPIVDHHKARDMTMMLYKMLKD